MALVKAKTPRAVGSLWVGERWLQDRFRALAAICLLCITVLAFPNLAKEPLTWSLIAAFLLRSGLKFVAPVSIVAVLAPVWAGALGVAPDIVAFAVLVEGLTLGLLFAAYRAVAFWMIPNIALGLLVSMGVANGLNPWIGTLISLFLPVALLLGARKFTPMPEQLGLPTLFESGVLIAAGLLSSRVLLALGPLNDRSVGFAVVPCFAGAFILFRHRSLAERAETCLRSMSAMLNHAHPYTGSHSGRVAELAREVGKRLGIGDQRLELLGHAALLHDIGKLAVDERILEKPGKLTDEEYEQVKLHPEFGARILRLVGGFGDVAHWVRFHHERVDGRGYPKGLKGDQIPLESKIICAIDAFDAMTGSDEDSIRRYRKPVSPEEALAELKRCSGTQFDETVVEAFEEALALRGIKAAR